MKAAMPRLHVEATITLDEEEVEILHHVMSYGFAKIFHEQCSHRFDVERMEKVFQTMRQELGSVKVAAANARNNLFDV